MTLDDQIRPSSITQAQRKFKRAKPTFTLIGRDFTTVPSSENSVSARALNDGCFHFPEFKRLNF